MALEDNRVEQNLHLENFACNLCSYCVCNTIIRCFSYSFFVAGVWDIVNEYNYKGIKIGLEHPTLQIPNGCWDFVSPNDIRRNHNPHNKS